MSVKSIGWNSEYADVCYCHIDVGNDCHLLGHRRDIFYGIGTFIFCERNVQLRMVQLLGLYSSVFIFIKLLYLADRLMSNKTSRRSREVDCSIERL